MPKFKSRAGVEIEAYVVTKDEKQLQVPTDEGLEQLKSGDALVGFNGATFRVRGALFHELFEETKAKTDKTDDEPKPPKKAER